MLEVKEAEELEIELRGINSLFWKCFNRSLLTNLKN